MLRHASCLCRHVLGSTAEALLQQHPSSCVTMQYAACSLLRTVTANTNVLADHVQQQQQQRMLSSGPAGTPAGDGIIIDPSAVQRLRELQEEAPDKQIMLRVEVEGGGCSGFQYKFRLDDSKAQDDLVFERDGVRVVCDTVSMDFLRGAVVEYEDNLMRSAFQISVNPNSESTCGCGTSFVAKI